MRSETPCDLSLPRKNIYSNKNHHGTKAHTTLTHIRTLLYNLFGEKPNREAENIAIKK